MSPRVHRVPAENHSGPETHSGQLPSLRG